MKVLYCWRAIFKLVFNRYLRDEFSIHKINRQPLFSFEGQQYKTQTVLHRFLKTGFGIVFEYDNSIYQTHHDATDNFKEDDSKNRSNSIKIVFIILSERECWEIQITNSDADANSFFLYECSA